MSKKYPRISATNKFKTPPGTTCEYCDNKSTHNIWVEYSYMRGDDEKYHVCEDHLKGGLT